MTIRTAKNRLFRPDARTGAEKAWEMRPGFFGLSDGWRIMFCLDGVEFRLFSFLLPIQEIYVLSVSSEFSLCRVVLERKTPVPEAFTGEKGSSSQGGGSVTGGNGVFYKNVPSFYPEYRDVLCGMSRYFISPGGAFGGGVRLHPLGNGFQKSENSA